MTDSDSDSSDCVAIDKPKTPSQPKDNGKPNQNEGVKEAQKQTANQVTSNDTALSNGGEHNEKASEGSSGKKRQAGLLEWIRSKTTKLVADKDKVELTDEQTDAILEVTFDNGTESSSKGGEDESGRALDEVMESPAKPDSSKYGKVYSGKKTTPSKSRLSPLNLSRETSPVPGPSWRKSPVKSMPEKSSFDDARPRNAAPVVVIERQDLFLDTHPWTDTRYLHNSMLY